MARGLKSKETIPPTEGEGANGLTGEAFLSLVRRQIALNAEKEALGARVKLFRKEAKLAGVALKKMDAAILMTTWEPAEVRESFETDHKYAQWLELPGHKAMQLDLFDQDPDVQSAEDWESRGFIAATTGRGVVGEPPADCPPDRVQPWMTGWNRGMEKNAPKKLEVVR